MSTDIHILTEKKMMESGRLSEAEASTTPIFGSPILELMNYLLSWLALGTVGA
jgi:hypothetical protein